MFNIQNNLPKISQSDIEVGLLELGLKKGGVLEVHSSLSAFGWVKGGATTVLNALMNTVGTQGTIAMSAYPQSPPLLLTNEEKARGLQWKVKIMPEDSPEKSGMGAIADMFKARQDVVCGHGRYRVCAWGNNAKKCSSGYKYILENDGWAVLLGVGIDRCSSLHLAEEIPVPKSISNYDEIPEDILRDYPQDQWGVGVGDGTPEDAWTKVYNIAENQGLVRTVKIGKADCKVFKVKAMVEIFKKWRQNDPYGLYGVSK